MLLDAKNSAMENEIIPASSRVSVYPSIPAMKRAFPIIISHVLLANSLCAQTVVNGRPSLVMNGRVAQLVVDIAGGSFIDFHLQDHGLNPLQWEEAGGPTAPRPMGHFLCLDRWGPPSDEEQKNGMPFHGEASRVRWDVNEPPSANGQRIRAVMSAILPLAGLKIKRSVELSTNDAIYFVKEEVTNVNKLGRIFNMVQHPTIGPPFLDESTVVDANGRRGFMQNSPLPNPESPAVMWPKAHHNGKSVDLRRLTNDPNPNVVSFTIDEEYGWVTACNPSRGLLIGYIWKRAEYPWFNAWRHAENGKPAARGLEFGTTGLHQPFPALVAKGAIFGRPIYEYLDANATVTKSYACFLFAIPKDYAGVAKVTNRNGMLTLHERGAAHGRELEMKVPPLK